MRWLPPLVLCVLAAGVRFFRIDAQSLWYDEGISAFQLTRSFAEILRAAALDTHPPLYYWTLKAWSEVFGASELGLRSLSAVSGVAAVGLTWLIGRKLFGRLPATLAAVLLAVAPLGVYYSQEVRMYTQVTALAMLAAYAYVRRGDWLYAIAGILTLYSQYLGIAILAALNLHALVWWRTRSRREWLMTECTLALLLWLMPLGLVLALGLRSGLFEVRYLVLSLPGLMLLAAHGITRLLRLPALTAAAAALLVVPASLALSQQYFEPALARDNYRGLVQTIEDGARPTDAVVLSAPNQTEIFTYYYRGDLPMYPLPAQRPIDADDTRRRLEAIRSGHERVWLVQWAMNEADPRGVIQNWLTENGFKATHQWYGSVQLALIGFAPPNAPTERLDVELDNGIVLEGYRLPSRTLKPGETLALTLVWRAEGPTATPWKVFTHLVDGEPSVVAQRDAEPADNLRPTTGWKPGERIEDNYGILVPDELPAGAYMLEIGMYSGEQRAHFDGQGDHLVLGQVQVTP